MLYFPEGFCGEKKYLGKKKWIMGENKYKNHKWLFDCQHVSGLRNTELSV